MARSTAAQNLVALGLADRLIAELLSADELALRNRALDGKRRDLEQRVMPLTEDEFSRALAGCFQVIKGMLGLVAEFPEDVVEAHAKDGVDGVRAALRALTREARENMVRALMRVVDDDS
jgi:hypothetical protein